MKFRSTAEIGRNGSDLIRWSRLCNVLLLLATQISVHAFNLHSAERGKCARKTWEAGEEGEGDDACGEERRETEGLLKL